MFRLFVSSVDRFSGWLSVRQVLGMQVDSIKRIAQLSDKLFHHVFMQVMSAVEAGPQGSGSGAVGICIGIKN